MASVLRRYPSRFLSFVDKKFWFYLFLVIRHYKSSSDERSHTDTMSSRVTSTSADSNQGTHTWLWDRHTLRLHRIKIAGPDTELETLINIMVDL